MYFISFFRRNLYQRVLTEKISSFYFNASKVTESIFILSIDLLSLVLCVSYLLCMVADGFRFVFIGWTCVVWILLPGSQNQLSFLCIY